SYPYGVLMRGIFRVSGWREGLSYILLLGVAMPIKYVWGNPSWVSVVGSAHGGLFVLYVLLAFVLFLREKWSFKKFAYALIASFRPSGPLVFDAKYLDIRC